MTTHAKQVKYGAAGLLMAFCCVALLTSPPAARAQNKFSFSTGYKEPEIQVNTPTIPPPALIPPPITNPDPTPVIPRIPIIPVVPQAQTPNLPIINQIDVTRPLILEGESTPHTTSALDGIQQTSEFPQADRCREGIDFLFVRGTSESVFTKPSSYSADLKRGEVLVSMHKPSRLGFITFPLGKIALSADSDVLIKQTHAGVFRIVNFDGRGQTVKIKLYDGANSDQNAKVVALAPGYELVVGDRVLKRSDIRVADGCARRHLQLLDNGKLAICEISTESVLTSSLVVAGMKHTEVDKERRILGAMSKMAAVLNYVNGAEGFAIENPGQVAVK